MTAICAKSGRTHVEWHANFSFGVICIVRTQTLLASKQQQETGQIRVRGGGNWRKPHPVYKSRRFTILMSTFMRAVGGEGGYVPIAGGPDHLQRLEPMFPNLMH